MGIRDHICCAPPPGMRKHPRSNQEVCLFPSGLTLVTGMLPRQPLVVGMGCTQLLGVVTLFCELRYDHFSLSHASYVSKEAKGNGR